MPVRQEGPRGFEMDEAGTPSSQPEGFSPPTFATFVLSLSTSILMHLGLVEPDEGEEPSEPNLPLAKHSIDILEMIRDKTQGNLDPDESRLLEGVLHDLRMRFVEASKG
jgi:hypothetical protein